MSLGEYLHRRKNSFRYALNGIRLTYVTQAHAKLHSFAAILVTGSAWFLGVSTIEWCLLLLAVALVWVSETINTAIEFTVDLASPDHHDLAGKAKDVAAGAVLLASCLAAIIGCIIFLPKLTTIIG